MMPHDYEAAVQAASDYMDEMMDIAYDAEQAIQKALTNHLKGSNSYRTRFIMEAAIGAAYDAAYSFASAYADALGVEGDSR